MNIFDRVKIKPLECEGRVMAFYEDSSGEQIKVRYFFNGTEHNVYFLPDEIEAVN